MIEKFNKNAKVEKFTNLLGIAIRLIVIDPFAWKCYDWYRMQCMFTHPGTWSHFVLFVYVKWEFT